MRIRERGRGKGGIVEEGRGRRESVLHSSSEHLHSLEGGRQIRREGGSGGRGGNHYCTVPPPPPPLPICSQNQRRMEGGGKGGRQRGDHPIYTHSSTSLHQNTPLRSLKGDKLLCWCCRVLIGFGLLVLERSNRLMGVVSLGSLEM